MSTPIVTVITPAYNVAPYIAEAIDSVLGQTFTDFEYLVVDDGSSDDTHAIALERARVDARIRVIDGNHLGSGAARNAGLKEARGEYVAFLDGDDRWSPKFLEKMVALIANGSEDVGVVFARTKIILENGQLAGALWQRSGYFDFDDLLALNNPTRTGSSLVLRKSVFDDVGLFDEQMSSAIDLEMWLRIATQSRSRLFYGAKWYLVESRERSDNISADRTKRYAALDDLLATYAPLMSRLPQGLAYTRPSVFAFRDGHEDFAQRWAAQVQTVPTRTLLRDGYGRRVMAWSALRPPQRERLRQRVRAARSAAIRALFSFGRLRPH